MSNESQGAKTQLIASHDIEEYLKSKQSLGSAVLVIGPGCNRREKDIIQLAKKRGVKCRELSQSDFDAQCKSLLGPVAPKSLRHLMLSVPQSYVDRRSSTSDLEAILKAETGDQQIVLILDGITDPHNLGAILRSANLFEVSAVIVPKKRSAQLNDTVRTVSAGASHHTALITVANLSRTIEMLKEAGFWVYCADLEGETPDSAKLSGKCAIVLGSEGSGPSREVKANSDAVLTIPTGGQIESLNVSVAAGILLYEIRRQGGFSFR